MKTPLRVLLEQAAYDLQKYSYPDIALAKEHLCDIISGTHGINIAHDTIEKIEIDEFDFEAQVYIEVSPYGALPRSSRSISTFETISFPAAIIDAADPVKQAKIIGLQRKIGEATAARARMVRDLKTLDDEIVDLEAALYNTNYPDYN